MNGAPPLVPVPCSVRDAIRDGSRDRSEHARALAALGLDALDVGGAGAATDAARPLRVVAWNLERCKHLEASAALLAAQQPDVVLLSELDWGMARSGQRHTARELAARLGCTYAYGVEFLELDLGGAAEREAFAGETNAVGFHGNAVLVRGALQRPALVRLETRGDWFDGARGERRVGGRCAVLAQIERAGRAITVASVHLDSHGTPSDRADEMRVLVHAIDAYDRDAPAVIGGDLNSFSLGLAEFGTPERVAAALRADPQRWSNPVPHEPLFEVAVRAGFSWEHCNAPGVATLRHATEGGSRRGAMKLDWMLCRGLAPGEPRVVDAVGHDGQMLSDHEAIAVVFAP